MQLRLRFLAGTRYIHLLGYRSPNLAGNTPQRAKGHGHTRTVPGQTLKAYRAITTYQAPAEEILLSSPMRMSAVLGKSVV